MPPNPQFNDLPFTHGEQNRVVDLAVGGLPAAEAVHGLDYGVAKRAPPLPEVLRDSDVGQLSTDGHGIETGILWQARYREPAERPTAVFVEWLLLRFRVILLWHVLDRLAV